MEGVRVALGPPPYSRRLNVVLAKNNHTATQNWWCILPDETIFEQAQAFTVGFAAGQATRELRAKVRIRQKDAMQTHGIRRSDLPWKAWEIRMNPAVGA